MFFLLPRQILSQTRDKKILSLFREDTKLFIFERIKTKKVEN